ncbi:MAG: ferredoxin [archaeon]
MPKTYKIIQKHEECIGCGACVGACPENWEFSEDGKAKPKKLIISNGEYRCNKRAEEVCPVEIIKIQDEK